MENPHLEVIDDELCPDVLPERVCMTIGKKYNPALANADKCFCVKGGRNFSINDYPNVKALLPNEGSDSVLCFYKELNSDSWPGWFKATLRLPYQTQQEALDWLKAFQLSSLTTFKVTNSYPNVKTKLLFKRRYRCQHNTRSKSEKANSRATSKNTCCTASLTISIKRKKKPRPRTMDPHMPSYPMVVTWSSQHNHPISEAAVLRHRPVAPATKAKFEALYKSGLKPREAWRRHRQDLQKDMSERGLHICLEDRAYMPGMNWCYWLYYKMNPRKSSRQNHVCTLSDLCYIQHFTEIMNIKTVTIYIQEDDAALTNDGTKSCCETPTESVDESLRICKQDMTECDGNVLECNGKMTECDENAIFKTEVKVTGNGVQEIDEKVAVGNQEEQLSMTALCQALHDIYMKLIECLNEDSKEQFHEPLQSFVKSWKQIKTNKELAEALLSFGSEIKPFSCDNPVLEDFKVIPSKEDSKLCDADCRPKVSTEMVRDVSDAVSEDIFCNGTFQWVWPAGVIENWVSLPEKSESKVTASDSYLDSNAIVVPNHNFVASEHFDDNIGTKLVIPNVTFRTKDVVSKNNLNSDSSAPMNCCIGLQSVVFNPFIVDNSLANLNDNHDLKIPQNSSDLIQMNSNTVESDVIVWKDESVIPCVACHTSNGADPANVSDMVVENSWQPSLVVTPEWQSTNIDPNNSVLTGVHEPDRRYRRKQRLQSLAVDDCLDMVRRGLSGCEPYESNK